MQVSGISLMFKVGQQVPAPAPLLLMESLRDVEVTHQDEGRAGFQMVFQVGRLGRFDLENYRIIKSPLLKAGNRVVLVVTIGATAEVLIDGIITHQQFSPSMEPGASTFTITGEDISVLMDRKEEPIEHPEQDEKVIVEQILQKYASYGVVADVKKPPLSAPSRRERIPVKQGTDLEYIQLLATRYGYVFYLTPGPSERSTAYWGPPKQPGQQPQRALTVNMQGYSNVESLSFQHSALSPTRVSGQVQDRKTNQIRPFNITNGTRPALAQTPSIQNQICVRDKQFRDTGHTLLQAQTRAQAETDRSVDEVITVTGELDTVRYGELLKIREIVGLRGVGYSYDGLYYVKQVSHRIRQGEYKQSFTITREGLDTTIQSLPV